MDYYNRANELKEDTIEIRRYLHKNAEVGLDLPNTVEYVMKQLKEYGIQPPIMWTWSNCNDWYRKTCYFIEGRYGCFTDY